MTKQTILDVDRFPIVGWAGPSGAMLRPNVMRGMAEAGFTISHSSVQGGASEVIKALDIAAESNVKLLLVHPAWHVGDNYRLDDEHKQQVRALVEAVREHPG